MDSEGRTGHLGHFGWDQLTVEQLEEADRAAASRPASSVRTEVVGSTSLQPPPKEELVVALLLFSSSCPSVDPPPRLSWVFSSVTSRWLYSPRRPRSAAAGSPAASSGPWGPPPAPWWSEQRATQTQDTLAVRIKWHTWTTRSILQKNHRRFIFLFQAVDWKRDPN